MSIFVSATSIATLGTVLSLIALPILFLMNIDALADMTNYHPESDPTFANILRLYYDTLEEEADLFDARLTLSTPTFPYNETHFAITLISEVSSAEEARFIIRSLSKDQPNAPLYVLRKISEEIEDNAEIVDCSPMNVLFMQNPFNKSVISGYKYDLLFQKTDTSTFAVICSIFGVEFDSKDDGMHEEYSHKFKIASDTPLDRRKAKELKRKFKSKGSLSSISDEMSRQLASVYDHIDEIVDRNFEIHLKHDTIPKLLVRIT
eukprot:480795_1